MLTENKTRPKFPIDTLLIVGSNLYGTNTETSDLDRRGFFLEPVEYLLGLKSFKSWESPTEDTVIWGFSHYFRMLMGGSPNVLETLFVDTDNTMGFPGLWHVGPIFKFLRQNRQSFITLKAVKNMQAFANSEYQAFVMNPDSPQWKRAADAIRLNYQAIELCRDDDIQFPRREASILREIRNGEMSFDDACSLYESISKDAYAARDVSFLRDDVDPEVMKEFYLHCIQDRMREAYGW